MSDSQGLQDKIKDEALGSYQQPKTSDPLTEHTARRLNMSLPQDEGKNTQSFVQKVKALPTVGRFIPVVHLDYCRKNDLVFPMDGSGWSILSRQDIFELIDELEKFIASVTDAEIEEENKELEIRSIMNAGDWSRDKAIAWLNGHRSTRSTSSKNKSPGYIYLLHAEGTNRYKIGLTKNLEKRIKRLREQSPYPLRLAHSFYSFDVFGQESELHDRYTDRRVHGEWFELGNTDVEYICSFKGAEV